MNDTQYETKAARNLASGDMIVLRDGPAFVRFVQHGPGLTEGGRILDRDQVAVELNDRAVVLPEDRVVQFYRPTRRYE